MNEKCHHPKVSSISRTNPSLAKQAEETIRGLVKSQYLQAVTSFSPPSTIFKKIFVTGEVAIITELYPYPSTIQNQIFSNSKKQYDHETEN